MHAVRTIISKEIVTDAAHSAARVLKDPPVNWKDTDGNIPWERNTVGTPPIVTTPDRIGAVPYVYPTSTRSQEIESPRRSIVLQEFRNTQPLYTPINGFSSKHRYPTLTWSKVIR